MRLGFLPQRHKGHKGGLYLFCGFAVVFNLFCLPQRYKGHKGNFFSKVCKIRSVCAYGVIFNLFFAIPASAQSIRKDISLNSNWVSIADEKTNTKYTGFEKASYPTATWKKVNVPHNWDQYEGYRRLLHGNRHGDSWYRKIFTNRQSKTGKRFFLFFEGVGSYATVYLNNKKVGEHIGGRTTFTLDVTDAIKTDGSANQLATNNLWRGSKLPRHRFSVSPLAS